MNEPRNKPFEPDYAVHPGMLLEQELESRQLSQADFARRIGRTAKLVSEIISGKNPIEPETAIQFERVLEIGADIWLRLESQYRLAQARRVEEEKLALSEEWLRQFPVKEIADWRVIRKGGVTAEKAHDLLVFFGVASPAAFEQRYERLVVRYRRSKKLEASRNSVLAWLRYGEIVASTENLPTFDRTAFRGQLREIRKLTTQKIQDFLPTLRDLCRESGVAFVLIPSLSKTCLSGAAFWAQGKTPVIQQSLRHKTNDHFWFTFFHEAAHIILHNSKDIFVDDENGSGDGLESEANEFATDILVGKKALSAFLAKGRFGAQDIRQFANSVGVHPGIVVGMLQHLGAIPWSHLNALKAKYEWVQNSRADKGRG